MILSPPVGWTARLQAERTVPRDSRSVLRNGSLKVRHWPEGDRTAGSMASIAPGAASPYPTGIPHPSEPPTSSQPERWRLPWRRRQCQPSTGIRGFGEVRGPIQRARAHTRARARPRGPPELPPLRHWSVIREAGRCGGSFNLTPCGRSNLEPRVPLAPGAVSPVPLARCRGWFAD